MQPKNRTNGGFEHELAAKLIEAYGKRHSKKIVFETEVGGRRLDVCLFDKTTGKRTYFNIGITDPEREAVNIEVILKLPVMKTSKFIFIARHVKFAKEIENLLKEKDPSNEILNRVEIKTIADLIIHNKNLMLF